MSADSRGPCASRIVCDCAVDVLGDRWPTLMSQLMTMFIINAGWLGESGDLVVSRE